VELFFTPGRRGHTHPSSRILYCLLSSLPSPLPPSFRNSRSCPPPLPSSSQQLQLMSTGMKKLLISLLFLFFLLQIPRLWKHHPEKELETSVNTTPNLPSSPFLLLLSPPCRPPLAAAPPRSRARRCRTCQRSGPTERCAAPPWPCLPHHLRRFWTAKKPRIPLDSSPQAPPTGRRLQELSSDLSIDGIANPRAASRRDRASRGSQGVAPPCGCGARSTMKRPGLNNRS
jgi:hypothetical protein